MIFFFFFTAST